MDSISKLITLVERYPAESAAAARRLGARIQNRIDAANRSRHERVTGVVQWLDAARNAVLTGDKAFPPVFGDPTPADEPRWRSYVYWMSAYAESHDNLSGVTATHAYVTAVVEQAQADPDWNQLRLTVGEFREQQRRSLDPNEPDATAVPAFKLAQLLREEIVDLEKRRTLEDLWTLAMAILVAMAYELDLQQLAFPLDMLTNPDGDRPEDNPFAFRELIPEYMGSLGELEDCGPALIALTERVTDRLTVASSLLESRAIDPATRGSSDHPNDLAGDSAAAAVAAPCELRRVGNYFVVSFQGQEVSMPYLLGLRYLQILIERSPRSISALELVRLVNPPAPGLAVPAPHQDTSMDADDEDPVEIDELDSGHRRQPSSPDPVGEESELPATDEEAIRAGRSLIKEFEAKLSACTTEGECEEVRAKLQKVRDYLSTNSNLRGKPKLDGEREKARRSVGNAIRRATRELEVRLPGLALHFRESVKTPSGANPAYEPATPTTWMLS